MGKCQAYLQTVDSDTEFREIDKLPCNVTFRIIFSDAKDISSLGPINIVLQKRMVVLLIDSPLDKTQQKKW